MTGSQEYTDVLSRRRFAELAGATGVVALAGCTGDGGDGGTGESTDPSDENASEGDGGDGTQAYDKQHLSRTNVVPANAQFNLQNPNSRSAIAYQLVFDEFTKFNYARGEFVPHAISDWEFTGDTFEMTVRKGLTWDDGDPVTAEDIATQLRLNQITNGSMWNYTESVDTPDERTVVLTLQGDVNPRIIEFDVLGDNWVHQKADVFGEYLETYESGDEDEAARQLQEFAYQDVVASGPFSLEQAGQQQLLTTRRDDHPDSENVNFSEYAFRYIDGNQQTHQALINLTVDSIPIVFAPPEVVDQMPDAVQLETTPGKWGMGLVPNHEHRHAGDRAVRQAIQYVVDRKAVVQNVGDTLKQAPELPVGIPSDDQERWLGDAMSDFDDYGVGETMTDEATAVLKEAGYSKNDGTWQDSDGNPVRLPVTAPAGWSDWITATETIVDQLNAFGFEATVDSRSYDAMASTVWPNGDFALSAGSWLPGGASAAFPYFSLYHQLVEHASIPSNYPAMIESQGGSEADVTVPGRDGDDLTVNPSDRLEELSQTSDDAAIQEIVSELAWVTNVDLPVIPVMEKLDETFLTTDEWSVPEQGSEKNQVKWPNAWLPKQGDLTYTGE
ncbi:ABC transporter substrate-binding protein [Halomicrobium urmianum]|uniref:ABC transporter substrate-binding protein n=1 Tax=Halomicrobium urmianum TaxID=1586233 RepID=UPI001CD95383|nr:ABC transporter substrate-binding protein [Halomicrobium urmianum]